MYKGGKRVYPTPWQFLPKGGAPQKVKVTKPNGYAWADLKFVTSTGLELELSEGDQLNLPPAQSEAQYFVYALLMNADGTATYCGSMTTMTRSTKTYYAKLVDLGGTYSLETLRTGLNNIYKPYGINWVLDLDTDFKGDNDYKVSLNTILDEGVGPQDDDAFFSEYTANQKALNSLYRSYSIGKSTYDDKAVYLFALPSGTQQGDMPIGHQWGYLFGNVKADILAHELGHGKLSLTHTFDMGVTQGNTENLMDYHTSGSSLAGTELVARQWLSLHDEAKLAPFQNDGNGAAPYFASARQNIIRLIELIRCAYMSNTSFNFPKPSYFSNMGIQPFVEVLLQDANVYTIQLVVEKDILGLTPKKINGSPVGKSLAFYFDGFKIVVSGNLKNAFQSYLFPNSNAWGDQKDRMASKIEDFVAKGDIKNAAALLFETSSCTLSELSYSSKFQLLKYIAELPIQEDRLDYGVVALLESIAQSDIEAQAFIIDIRNNPSVVNSLYLGTNDEYTRNSYITQLLKIFSLNYQHQTLSVPERNHFVKSPNGSYTAEKFVIKSSDKVVKLAKWGVSSYNTPVWDIINLAPLEPIALVAPTALSGGTDELLYVPAIYLHFYEFELANKNMKQFLAGAGIIAGTVAGGSLIFSGVTVIHKIMGYTQLANLATSLVLQNQSIREKLNKTPEGEYLLENWNSISIAIDLLTISVDVARSFARNANKVLDDFDKVIPDLEKQQIQKRIVKCENIVANGGRFVARSRDELFTHLNSIVNKPSGKTYNGKIFKSVSKNAEINHNAKPDIISEYSIEEAWGRYDLQGESAMYYSNTLNGNQIEMSHYGDWNSYSTYEFNSVKIDNVLDLTDDIVRQQLGSEFYQLVLTTGAKAEIYEFTNVIGTWARGKGYKGLIVPGARGNQDYTNIIVFNQSDLTSALSGITPIKLK